jgi:hypothetical protein
MCGARLERHLMDAHHINGHGRKWAERNGCEPDNRPENGQCLCRYCHTSLTHRGKLTSEETRAKLRAAVKGIPKSAEARAAMKGIPKTPEHRAKIGAANRGRVHTPESKANMSAAKIGVPLSPEHRAAQSAAHQRRLHALQREDDA